MKALINPECIKQYQKLNKNIEDIIPDVVQNLENFASQKTCHFKHIENREGFAVVEIPEIENRLIKFVADDIDQWDVLNFALNAYIGVYRRSIILKKFREGECCDFLLDAVFFHLNFDGDECIEDKIKNRTYAYTTCPVCGNEHFYLSWDRNKNNIYVQCPEEKCKYHKIMDLIGFLELYYNLNYVQAVEKLGEICEIEVA